MRVAQSDLLQHRFVNSWDPPNCIRPGPALCGGPIPSLGPSLDPPQWPQSVRTGSANPPVASGRGLPRIGPTSCETPGNSSVKRNSTAGKFSILGPSRKLKQGGFEVTGVPRASEFPNTFLKGFPTSPTFYKTIFRRRRTYPGARQHPDPNLKSMLKIAAAKREPQCPEERNDPYVLIQQISP